MTLRVLFILMLCAGLPLMARAGDLPTPENGPVLRI
jgi:phosphate transport system substrate-binding protein